MDTINTAKALTKVGVTSLGIVALIGIFTIFLAFLGVNLSTFNGTFIEDLYAFLMITLSITAGFCLPAAFIISCTNIAEALKESKRSEN